MNEIIVAIVLTAVVAVIVTTSVIKARNTKNETSDSKGDLLIKGMNILGNVVNEIYEAYATIGALSKENFDNDSKYREELITKATKIIVSKIESVNTSDGTVISDETVELFRNLAIIAIEKAIDRFEATKSTEKIAALTIENEELKTVEGTPVVDTKEETKMVDLSVSIGEYYK